jgi:serine/threonine protein kinase
MATKQLDEEALFHAARRITASEARELFINQACSDDAGLAERVRSLLEMHEQEPESFRTSPMRSGDFTIAERAGSRIGPYRLMEQIGEGGFGLVFVAEQQEPVKRKVALKVIKPGMDTRQVIARFEAERQALALMDHPNIARVLDAGATDSGRPYFVMELVRGIPITDYCDQNQLTTRERLELFITVCQAIQHAHQKGIIHRDIKPSNVLVTSHDGKPVPKVIDFGVAKAINQHLTERTLYTNFAQLLGTPLYMSPEQAEMSGLDIDTRSDVYSLGVLLYELLTGTTPMEKKRIREAAYDDIRRLIREEEPPRPSTRLDQSGDSLSSIAALRKTEPAKLSKLVRGELDLITMKALEKDRTRRYETANGFARDIQRYLNDEPVDASSPSAGYRLRKFAHKNRAVLATAAMLAFLLVSATVYSLWQFARAKEAQRLAQEAMAAEAEQRDRATEQRRLAEQNEAAARDSARAEKTAKEAAQAREAEIKAVVDFLQTSVLAAARPEGQEGGLGRDVTLRGAIEAAMPTVERKFAKQPLIEARLRMTMGRTYYHLGEAKRSAEQYEKAHKLFSEHAGPDDADTLASLSNLSNSYAALGRDQEALKLRQKTLKAFESKFGRDDPRTLAGLNNLANSYAALGQNDEALRLREETLSRVKAKFGPEHENTISSMNNLAMSYAVVGRNAEALALREQVVTLRRAILGPDHPDTLTSMLNLVQSYGALGRYEDALKLCEETLVRMKGPLGPDHPDVFLCMQNLANIYFALGRHHEALKVREETFERQKAKLGASHPDTIASMVGLGNSYGALGRHEEALKLREETLILRKTKLGADHPETLAAMHNLSNSYAALGRYAEALKLRAETLTRMTGKLGREHPYSIEAMQNLAASYFVAGRYAESLKLYEEAIAILNRILGPNLPARLAEPRNGLAWLLATASDDRVRDPAKAIQLASQAVEAMPKSANYRCTLGVARYRAGDWKLAIADLEQAVQLRRPDDSANAPEEFFLAMALWQVGEKDKAREWFGKAADWMDKGTKDDPELKRFRGEAAEMLGVNVDKK